MTLFDNIKKISKQRGYSIAEVERKAGISTNYLYQWKKRNPSPESLEKVADVLGVSVDTLLGKSTAKPQKVDLAKNDTIMMFEGMPIPEEDMETVRKILEGLRNAKK
ncbi:helix-turn-helix domain-containing protein [Pediococcus parvulus]|uniref:helix-turn-helix domain-containing protein n=1 Tax=Pediococcus parvulus TaxID=54062 RepID=UPI00345E313B